METIDLYIDASFNDKRKNGKCAAILIHDEKEYQWSMGMTSERIHNNWPCQGTINSTEYEISTLIFFLKYLNDRKISNINFIVYTDSLNFFESYYNLVKSRNKCKKMIDSLRTEILYMTNLNNVSFEIRWIPGHKNIYGNVKANYYTQHHFKQSNKEVAMINTWKV